MVLLRLAKLSRRLSSRECVFFRKPALEVLGESASVSTERADTSPTDERLSPDSLATRDGAILAIILMEEACVLVVRPRSFLAAQPCRLVAGNRDGGYCTF